ncbi:immunoglobulin-like domain-containing protein [Neotamlana sedimentorum]|uniref:immunoglobulin-like domain-containing protein n=1 Tax=Neotamlana sedimentorum TaxID=1435349 RepID=UPI00069A44A5|nr:immunoglobulin-like domain-containing protein [Tamlana sedimentorum]
MKNLKNYIAVFILSGLILTSCSSDTDTADVSQITYFNIIELLGDEVTTHPVGTTYTDPGVIAYEGDEIVTDRIITDNPVDDSTIGIYYINYSITNADGFEKVATRTVIVHPENDSGVDYSGVYTGEARGETMIAGCNITKIAPSTYVADDFFGGVYCCGARNYGLAYRLLTYFYVSDDNTTYTWLSTTSPWGPWEILNSAIDGTTLSHTVQQGTFGFDVKLIKE